LTHTLERNETNPSCGDHASEDSAKKAAAQIGENIRKALGGKAYPERVMILDTTLRDGEQTPNVALSLDDKIKIAQALDDLGVDIIEAGFPITSDGEKQAVKAIGKLGLKAEVLGLSRSSKTDIDAVLDCDLKSIHVFLATSDIHMQTKLKMTRDQVVEKAAWAVDYAKSHGLKVEFSPEDATRSDVEFVKRVICAVQEAKVDRIDIPDTVGVMIPQSMGSLIAELRTVAKVPLAVHCHDDFGLSVSNSFAAVLAGAEEIHCTINGLGERAGNAALEEIAVGLSTFFGIKTNINLKKLAHVSRLVSHLTGVHVQPNKAIVGDNAFAHESGIHVHGVLGESFTYEAISPELVGKERELVVGKHTGTHAVQAKLKNYAIEMPENQLKDLVVRIKKLSEGGKKIDDAELIAMAYDVLGKTDEQECIKLEEFAVFTGINFTPTATVTLNVAGHSKRASESGIGPIDASLNAIRAAVNKNIVLKEYRLEAITGGSESLCEVTVKLADSRDDSILSLGKSVGPDIVLTSVEAEIISLNRLCSAKRDLLN
jgi:2-isopropylmalate synthase